MVGLIMIGLARCIAMVIVWCELARGDNEYSAGLVAFNAIFQMVFYSVFAYIFITVLPPYLGLRWWYTSPYGNSPSVLIYLGIPFFGNIVRFIFLKTKGKLVQTVIPKINPSHNALFTILVISRLRANHSITAGRSTHRHSSIHHFVVCFRLVLYGRLSGDYGKTVTIAFHASGVISS
jgi:ACR3 family arsenite transporter